MSNFYAKHKFITVTITELYNTGTIYNHRQRLKIIQLFHGLHLRQYWKPKAKQYSQAIYSHHQSIKSSQIHTAMQYSLVSMYRQAYIC